MSIQGLAQDLELDYEGEIGSFVFTGSTYKCEYTTDDESIVEVKTICAKTHKQIGSSEFRSKKTYKWA